MACEELSIKGFLNEIKDVSSGPHPRKFCFVLGAGASKTSGIKSGQDLVAIWDKELLLRNEEDYLNWKKEKKITEKNRYSFYSQYYEKRFKRQPMDGYNYLEKLMEKAKPSIGYVMLSYLLSKTENNVVITTNFDHLIEDTVNYYTQTMPLVIGHEALAHYVTKQLNRPTIIKIHRDLLFNPANRCDEVEKLHNNWKEALDKIFSEYHPIFIGYAGNDNSLMDYLIEKSEEFSNNDLCFPYWMLYKNEKLEGKVDTFLEKASGYFIKHNGFDEVLCLLGDLFGYKMPSEDEFLNEAKERYKALSSSIDEFTENRGKEPDISNFDKFTGNSGKESDINNNDSDLKNTVQDEAVVTEAVERITNNSRLNRMYREVMALRDKGKYEEAILLNQELIKLSPENARYHQSLGFIFYITKRYSEALPEMQKAVKLEPDDAFYHGMLGDVLARLERYDEALSEMYKAIELMPDNAYYRCKCGDVLTKLERYDEALPEMQKAIELMPNDAYYRWECGDVLINLERYDEALPEMQKAVELEPDDAFYHGILGDVLARLERYDEALPKMQKAVELEPDDAFYHRLLGGVLTTLKRYDEALSEMYKAIELMPDNAYGRWKCGDVLTKLERYDEALLEMQKAVELESDNAFYHYSLGDTLMKLERYDEALPEIQKAVELDSDNPLYGSSLDDINNIIKSNNK